MGVALGASAWNILRSVLQHGIRIVGIGLAASAGLAYLGSGFLSSLLFEVSATDPRTYLLIAIVLLAAGLAACWLPARRASRVEPIEALRIG